jgi:hypothetical protein
MPLGFVTEVGVMGRPPRFGHAMSPAERQRLRRHGVEPEREAEPQSPPEPASPPIVPVAAVADRGLIEQLSQERDQARAECFRLRCELDTAREEHASAIKAIMPKPEVVGDHIKACWCAFCGKQGGDKPEVEVMITGSIAHRLFICSECVKRCNEIITEARQRQAVQATGTTT